MVPFQLHVMSNYNPFALVSYQGSDDQDNQDDVSNAKNQYTDQDDVSNAENQSSGNLNAIDKDKSQ